MNREEWAALVRRLEPEARQNRDAYARKVAFLGALGYAVIALSLLVLAGLAAFVVYMATVGPAVLAKFLIPIVGLAFVIVRSLAVKIDPPDGVELRRQHAPELFRMIDDVNAKIAGPKVHKVLVDDEANAAVVQIPRRFALGQRNFLLLGLPYLQTLSPDEFRAVVAHELGHLSRNHGRFGTWIYRVRATWWQLLEELEERRSLGTGLFRRFFEWYVPRFDAYSFPLRRAHEFEADDAAAAAAGALPVASSLLSGTVAARHLAERYWPQVYARASTEHEPPQSAFAPIAGEVAGVRARAEAKAWMQSELRREPEPDDTHPSTRERIEHLGLSPDEVVAAAARTNGATAAEAFLGPAEAQLAELLDARWRSDVADAWREAHAEAQHRQAQLGELEQRAAEGHLTLDEARTLADLTEDFSGAEAALARYREVLEREPDDAVAHVALGRLLLDAGDESGLRHLEHAMAADADAVLPACALAIDFLEAHERDDEAAVYRERLAQRAMLLDAAGGERAELEPTDEFVAHDLPEELLERIRYAVMRQHDAGRAYVVRKRLQHLDDESPLYVIAVIPKNPWRTLWREAGDDEQHVPLADRVAEDLDLPVDFQLVVPGPRSGFENRFRELGDPVYSRD